MDAAEYREPNKATDPIIDSTRVIAIRIAILEL
jgi:hypothetical protein